VVEASDFCRAVQIWHTEPYWRRCLVGFFQNDPYQHSCGSISKCNVDPTQTNGGTVAYTQQQCEASTLPGTRKAVLAADETFFSQMMILVLMDLSSGYLVLESIENDRSFDTWFSTTEPRLKALGIEVTHAISDRAKALLKLAVTGFECASGADVFHEQYGISKWLSSALGRRKAKAQVQCDDAENALKTKSSKVSTEETEVLQAQRISAQETLENADKMQQEYREQLQAFRRRSSSIFARTNGSYNCRQRRGGAGKTCPSHRVVGCERGYSG